MSQSQLLKKRKFYPLFWTQFLGAFNDNFFKNALVILITFRAGSVLGIPSNQMVAVSGGIFILPFFLFSATAGQLADKYEKSKIIRMIKLAEIYIMILAAIGFLTQQFAFLLLVLFLMGLHSTFFSPIKYSIIPEHLDKSELVGGNALIEAGTFLAILIGTLLGGILISVPEIGPLAVSLGLVAAAVLGYWISRLIPEAKPLDPSLKIEWNPLPTTIKMIKIIWPNRAVFLSILGISWFWFFGATLLSLFPIYCKNVLKTNETVVTLFLVIFSIGTGAGSLLCEKLSRKRLELGLVPLGSIGLSVFAIDLFFQGIPVFRDGVGAIEFLSQSAGRHIAFDLLLLSIFGGLFIVPLYTLVQERSDQAMRSRVIAANNIINAIFMVAASVFLVLMMRAGFNSVQLFLALGLLNGVVAIYIYTVLSEFLIRFGFWIIANIFYRLKITGDEKIPENKAVLQGMLRNIKPKRFCSRIHLKIVKLILGSLLFTLFFGTTANALTCSQIRDKSKTKKGKAQCTLVEHVPGLNRGSIKSVYECGNTRYTLERAENNDCSVTVSKKEK